MLKSIFWKPYSHLFIVGDNANWSIDEEAAQLQKIALRLSVPALRTKGVFLNIPQVVHYVSQFSLQYRHTYKSRHRISFDYFHGKPEHGESYKKCFEAIRTNHEKISRIRVSTQEMKNLIETTGNDPEKVVRIPIGVDTEVFTPQTIEKRRAIRDKLEIPHNAIVIGSFLKDGVGWDEGNEPKFIKGPDVLLKVLDKLKKDVPNMWVLLSGPARGYIKNGLDSLSIPYRHRYLKHPEELTDLYDALDLYIITSREEGGPKACLESMAKGVPLVTTAVGQCKDLVKSGENAMMTAIDNRDELYTFSLKIIREGGLRQSLIIKGLRTAKENNYDSQLPVWKAYFKNLIIS